MVKSQSFVLFFYWNVWFLQVLVGVELFNISILFEYETLSHFVVITLWIHININKSTREAKFDVTRAAVFSRLCHLTRPVTCRYSTANARAQMECRIYQFSGASCRLK
jgi:hypothetical protein